LVFCAEAGYYFLFKKKTGWMGGGSGHGDGRVRVGWPPMVMMVRQDAVWNGVEGAARGIWSYRSFMAAGRHHRFLARPYRATFGRAAHWGGDRERAPAG